MLLWIYLIDRTLHSDTHIVCTVQDASLKQNIPFCQQKKIEAPATGFKSSLKIKQARKYIWGISDGEKKGMPGKLLQRKEMVKSNCHPMLVAQTPPLVGILGFSSYWSGSVDCGRLRFELG